MEFFVAKPVRRIELETVLDEVIERLESRGQVPGPGSSPNGAGAELTPNATVLSGAALDGVALAGLRVALGAAAEVVLPDLVSTYLTQSAELVQALQRAAADDDRPAVVAAAHKLRGGSGTFGAERLTALCEAFEYGNAEAAPPAAVEVIAAEFDRVRVALLEQYPDPA